MDEPDLIDAAKLVCEHAAALVLIGPMEMGKMLQSGEALTKSELFKLVSGKAAAINLGILYAKKLLDEQEEAQCRANRN